MIADNLARVKERIEHAAARSGRNPADITLVGVSKFQPVAAMMEAYQAGLRHFGENRVEEITAKIPAFLAQTDPADPPVIHMIGHLQSRKVAGALSFCRMIHSVDSVKLAERIDRLAEQGDYPPVPVLLECNVSGEPGKDGFALANWDTDAVIRPRFFEAVAAMAALPRLELIGLMTMAPIVAEPEEARPCFSSLRRLMAQCALEFPRLPWRHLSMGMTDDFEIAVEEGATLVRVGRAIFSK